MNGIINLLPSASDDEILAYLQAEDFLQFFLTCSSLADAQIVFDVIDRIQRIINEQNIQEYEPYVVSIASFPPEERNRGAYFFERHHVAVVALPFEQYIRALLK